MSSVLDEVLALIPDVVPGYIDQDPAHGRFRVRADDGRIVTLSLSAKYTAAGIRMCEPSGDAGWFGDPAWSAARRWVALMSVHVDESINVLGRNHATAYRQVDGGFDPLI